MNTSTGDPIPTTDTQRLPFSLSILEITLAILVGVGAWFGLRYYLQSILPFPCGSSVDNILLDCGWTKEQAWQTLGHPLFTTYALPLSAFLAISTIFLIHCIRRNNRHFSRLGNLAFSWPIFSTLGFFSLSVFSFIFMPVGVALAIIATINSLEFTKQHKWDWLSFPYNFVWLIVFGTFVSKLLSLYGD